MKKIALDHDWFDLIHLLDSGAASDKANDGPCLTFHRTRHVGLNVFK